MGRRLARVPAEVRAGSSRRDTRSRPGSSNRGVGRFRTRGPAGGLAAVTPAPLVDRAPGGLLPRVTARGSPDRLDIAERWGRWTVPARLAPASSWVWVSPSTFRRVRSPDLPAQPRARPKWPGLAGMAEPVWIWDVITFHGDPAGLLRDRGHGSPSGGTWSRHPRPTVQVQPAGTSSRACWNLLTDAARPRHRLPAGRSPAGRLRQRSTDDRPHPRLHGPDGDRPITAAPHPQGRGSRPSSATSRGSGRIWRPSVTQPCSTPNCRGTGLEYNSVRLHEAIYVTPTTEHEGRGKPSAGPPRRSPVAGRPGLPATARTKPAGEDAMNWVRHLCGCMWHAPVWGGLSGGRG